MQYNNLPWNMFQVGRVLTIISQMFIIVLRLLGHMRCFFSAIPVATRKKRSVLILRSCSLGLVMRKICATAENLLNLFSASFHMWPTLGPLTLPPLQNNAGRRWEVCVFLFSFFLSFLGPFRVTLCCCGCNYLGGVPEHCKLFSFLFTRLCVYFL